MCDRGWEGGLLMLGYKGMYDREWEGDLLMLGVQRDVRRRVGGRFIYVRCTKRCTTEGRRVLGVLIRVRIRVLSGLQ